jgi:acetoin utilization deacetylase AcuC-like enzyme
MNKGDSPSENWQSRLSRIETEMVALDLNELRLPPVIFNPHQQLHATDKVLIDGDRLDTREVPARAHSISRKLGEAGFILEPAIRDYGLAPILRAHEQGYIDFLIDCQNMLLATPERLFLPAHFKLEYMKGCGLLDRIDNRRPALDDGTPITSGTWHAAYWSAQCALNAVDVLLENRGVVYSLCRPSGHHAGLSSFSGIQSEFGGFCFLNNVAIAALELEARGHKVAILDIDAHHGNGTQGIMYSRPTLVCSIHGNPSEGFFPIISGFEDELGTEGGEGFNFNFCLPRGTQDLKYLRTLNRALDKIAADMPDYLLVSLGVDFMANDPYGGLAISDEGLKMISRLIAQLGIPTLLIQEGGYQIDKLGDYVREFLLHFNSQRHTCVALGGLEE